MPSPRENLVAAIQNQFKAVRAGVNNYSQTYRMVLRDPIADDTVSSLQAGEAIVGIYELPETKMRQFGMVQATLPIIIEFYYKPKQGDSASVQLNRILGEIQRVLYVDITQGNLAINTEEVSNQIDIDGIYDMIVNGSITFNLTYRTAIFDPTQAVF